MTKQELVKKISEKTGCCHSEVLNIVESFMETVKGSLADGENVYLRGFGTFMLKHHADKTARNISKNTSIIIPAHDAPAFRPSKDFVSSVSGLSDSVD